MLGDIRSSWRIAVCAPCCGRLDSSLHHAACPATPHHQGLGQQQLGAFWYVTAGLLEALAISDGGCHAVLQSGAVQQPKGTSEKSYPRRDLTGPVTNLTGSPDGSRQVSRPGPVRQLTGRPDGSRQVSRPGSRQAVPS